jgi:hypothetical protein
VASSVLLDPTALLEEVRDPAVASRRKYNQKECPIKDLLPSVGKAEEQYREQVIFLFTMIVTHLVPKEVGFPNTVWLWRENLVGISVLQK